MKKTLYLTLFFAASVTASAQQVFDARGWKYLSPETKWVEKTMKDMSLEERIAQLMVVRVPLNMDDKQAKEFSDRMNGYGVAFAIGMDEHGQEGLLNAFSALFICGNVPFERVPHVTFLDWHTIQTRSNEARGKICLRHSGRPSRF